MAELEQSDSLSGGSFIADLRFYHWNFVMLPIYQFKLVLSLHCLLLFVYLRAVALHQSLRTVKLCNQLPSLSIEQPHFLIKRTNPHKK